MNKLLMILGCILLTIFSNACSFIHKPTLQEQQQAQGFIDKGVVALRAGQLADAQAAFSMAHSITESAPANDGLGCVELMKGNVQDAEDYFRAAYNMDNSYGTALGHLALIFEIRNNHEGAKKLYEEALEEKPEDFRNRNNYAALIVEDNSELARAELHRAKTTGNHPVIVENIERLAK